jgi:hypothetical protein
LFRCLRRSLWLSRRTSQSTACFNCGRLDIQRSLRFNRDLLLDGRHRSKRTGNQQLLEHAEESLSVVCTFTAAGRTRSR